MWRNWTSTAVTLLILVSLCALAVVAWRSLARANRQARWRRLFERHRPALCKRYRQLVRLNDYGFEERAKWHQELAKFRTSTGFPMREPSAFDAYATRLIGLWVAAEDRQTDRPALSVQSPEDYEHYCADLLRRAGWRAEVTQLSGDQGVDIVAEKTGYRMALQCKLHSVSPVGNKAVQEVYAAAGFIDASHAAVVSNRGYTSAARALADKLNVLLLHHIELNQLDSILKSSVGHIQRPQSRTTRS